MAGGRGHADVDSLPEMAHRCRTCGEAHFSVHSAISFPFPDKLAHIDEVMPDLLEAAREFEAFGPGTPLEFTQWLAVSARRVAGIRHRVK